jgi:hypothetical protein
MSNITRSRVTKSPTTLRQHNWAERKELNKVIIQQSLFIQTLIEIKYIIHFILSFLSGASDFVKNFQGDEGILPEGLQQRRMKISPSSFIFILMSCSHLLNLRLVSVWYNFSVTSGWFLKYPQKGPKLGGWGGRPQTKPIGNPVGIKR